MVYCQDVIRESILYGSLESQAQGLRGAGTASGKVSASEARASFSWRQEKTSGVYALAMTCRRAATSQKQTESLLSPRHVSGCPA